MTTILVVDDEPGVRDLLHDALDNAGFETEMASNGAEALDLLRRRSADICIVDINMPIMNGFEFLERLREHDTQTPVLMLGLPDEFVEHGDPVKLLAMCGLDATGIEQSILKRFGSKPALVRTALTR